MDYVASYRAYQIRTMKECVEDAGKVDNADARRQIALAIVMFGKRTWDFSSYVTRVNQEAD